MGVDGAEELLGFTVVVDAGCVEVVDVVRFDDVEEVGCAGWGGEDG